jgi:hypothetical protein
VFTFLERVTNPLLSAEPILTGKQEPEKLLRKSLAVEPAMTKQDPRIVAYPNPMREQVTFSFTLPQTQSVVVKVYDLQGREISLLHQGEARMHQNYQVEWKPGKDQNPGLFMMQLQAGKQVYQQKILFTR